LVARPVRPLMLRADTTSAAAWQRRALAAEARLAGLGQLGQPPLPDNLTAVLQQNTAEESGRLPTPRSASDTRWQQRRTFRGEKQAQSAAGKGRGRKGKGGRGRKGREEHAGKGRGGGTNFLLLPPLPTHLDAAAHAVLGRARREAARDPSAMLVLRGWQQHQARGVEGPRVRAAGVSSPGAANPYRAAPLPMRPCEGGGGAAGVGMLGPAPLFMAAERLEVLAAERAPYGLQMGGKSEAEVRTACRVRWMHVHVKRAWLHAHARTWCAHACSRMRMCLQGACGDRAIPAQHLAAAALPLRLVPCVEDCHLANATAHCPDLLRLALQGSPGCAAPSGRAVQLLRPQRQPVTRSAGRLCQSRALCILRWSCLQHQTRARWWVALGGCAVRTSAHTSTRTRR